MKAPGNPYGVSAGYPHGTNDPGEAHYVCEYCAAGWHDDCQAFAAGCECACTGEEPRAEMRE